MAAEKEESFRPGPMYEFPPFFTRQPNEDTWRAQLQQWQDVLIAYCEFTKKWQIGPSSPVFANPRIQRALRSDVIAAVLAFVVDQGSAERINSTDIYVFSHKPSDLAYELKQWAESTGHSSSVLTFYELQEGDLPGLPQFKHIDSYLMRKVVDILARKGDAAALKEDGEYVGLKLA